VRRLAHPQDLLLHFGEMLPAALDREVASGDHDSHRTIAHRRQEEFRQALEGRTRLDLEHHADMLGTQTVQARLQFEYVLGALHPRQPDQVRMRGDERQVVQVFVGERGELQVGIGEIDAAIGQ